ncbi:MAG: hypothetical protein M3444_18590, partial [Acidobacteriota bacterium]|nr:hypothetical protein [Acidobacteriota bacterium]
MKEKRFAFTSSSILAAFILLYAPSLTVRLAARNRPASEAEAHLQLDAPVAAAEVAAARAEA